MDPVAAIPGTSSSTTEKTATKRAAPDAPADDPKKPKVALRINNEAQQHSVSPPDTGILNRLIPRFSVPVPINNKVLITIETNDMTDFFDQIRSSLISAIYPDERYLEANVITDAEFRIVCRYLTKSRIDYVYSATTGRRPDGRIAMPRDMQIPKALADMINGIGPITVQGGAYTLIPQPEAHPAQAAERLATLTTYQILTAFSKLVHAAIARGFIRGGFLSGVVNGTAWWALSARSSINLAQVAVDQDSVTVVSVFKEWTPADALFCAMAQRRYNGLNDLDHSIKWVCDPIVGVVGLTNAFILGA